MTEQRPREPLGEAERAARMFVRASGETPASMTYIQTRLATLCQEQKAEPAILGQHLVADEQALGYVERAMIHAHAAAGITLSAEEKSHGEVINTLSAAFRGAAGLMHIPRSKLDGVLRDFPYSDGLRQQGRGADRLAQIRKSHSRI